MFLKQYFRGSALMLSALVALSVIVTRVFQRALTIVGRINSGDMPVDSGAIAEIVSNSTGHANSSIESIAVIFLGACWLLGIIDSYRLGVSEKK